MVFLCELRVASCGNYDLKLIQLTMKFIEVFIEGTGYILININSIYMIGSGDGTEKNWATIFFKESVVSIVEGKRIATDQAFISKKQFDEIRDTLTIKYDTEGIE